MTCFPLNARRATTLPDLLMPYHLFRPLSRRYGKLTFKAVNAHADMFNAS